MSYGLSYLTEIEGDVMAEWRDRSKLTLYQRDPEAWINDVLKKHWWSKQREIAQSFVDNTFTLVKSCNGVGKTNLAGDLVTWFVSVFPPEETSVLLSAPVREQINVMMFKYLRENYQRAIQMGNPLIGEITRAPKWLVTEPFDKDVVIPKRPADENLVSSFQGVHDGYVAVVLDEAGGLPEDLYTGANAVTTNEYARIFGIGNPDKLGTGFHQRFIDREKHGHWNLFTIGYDDTPNATGEIIVPDDPEEDRRIKGRLVQASWAAMMRKSAPPGIVAAKVDGEFPDADDTSFFDQTVIDKAADTQIIPDELDEIWLGVDLAFEGEDKSAIYMNHGGRVRLLDTWNKDQGVHHVQSARRIHGKAIEVGATQVRVDKSGIGAGVFSNLLALEEFKDRPYTLIGVNGAKRSPDQARFLNARAWHYWQMRQKMADGEIDLTFEDDTDLRDQFVIQPYKVDDQGHIVILPKTQMRRQGIASPDRLDAAIYSVIDPGIDVDSFAAGMQPGDVVHLDPWALAEMSMAGMPV